MVKLRVPFLYEYFFCFIHSALIWDSEFGWLIIVQETVFYCSLLFTLVWLFIHLVDNFFFVLLSQISDIFLHSLHHTMVLFNWNWSGEAFPFYSFLISRNTLLKWNNQCTIELLWVMYATKIYLNIKWKKKSMTNF